MKAITVMMPIGLVLLLAAPAWTACPTAARNSCGVNIVTLRSLCGSDFDTGYIESAYQLRSEIAGLANLASQRARDHNLRKFSQELVVEQRRMLTELVSLYRCVVGPEGPYIDEACITDVTCRLNTLCGSEFDKAYVRTLVPMLARSRMASDMASWKAAVCELRTFAKEGARGDLRNYEMLRLWQRIGFLTQRELDRACGINPTLPQCLQ